MKNDDLLDAIGEIDEIYIKKAEMPDNAVIGKRFAGKPRRRIGIPLAAIAACLLIALALPIMLRMTDGFLIGDPTEDSAAPESGDTSDGENENDPGGSDESVNNGSNEGESPAPDDGVMGDNDTGKPIIVAVNVIGADGERVLSDEQTILYMTSNLGIFKEGDYTQNDSFNTEALAELHFDVCLSDGTEQRYVLAGNVLNDVSRGVLYELTREQADSLRNTLME